MTTVTKLKAKLANKSGIEPKGNKVLVKPDEIEEFSAGGIALPAKVRERHEASASYGYVVAVGEDAWQHTVERVYHHHENSVRELIEERVTGYSEPFAKIGDRIAFSPYVGLDSIGTNGEKYKTINDEDVIALVDEGVTQTSIEARKPLGDK